MTVAEVLVEVEYANKSRFYSHGAYVADGLPNTSQVTYDTMLSLGWAHPSGAALADMTNHASPSFQLPTFILSVLALHRYMQHASSTIKGYRIRDVPHLNMGKPVSVSKRLNLTCIGPHIAIPFDDMESANNVLHITKNSNGLSTDNGALYLRGALTKEATIGDGQDGVTLQGVNVGNYANALNTALQGGGAGEGLASFFREPNAVAVADEVQYAVINTYEHETLKTKKGNPKRFFLSFDSVNSFEIIDATQRDTRRKNRARPQTGTGEQ